MQASEPASRHYVFDDVDQDAPTRPGCEPIDLYASGVKQVPVTRGEVTTLLLVIGAAIGAVIVGFDVAHFWEIGGYIGLCVALVQNGAALVLGASVVAMWRRR